jgi:sugar phosphate isomerase/epimerase
MTSKESTRSDVMKLVSLSTDTLQRILGDKSAIEYAKSIGCDAIDFNLCDMDFKAPESIYSKGDNEVIKYYTGIGEYAKKLGIIIHQTHGRIVGFTHDDKANEITLENARLDCLASSALGAKICVMHTASNIRIGKDAPAELMDSINDKMFFSIIPSAKKYGIILATETFGDAPAFGTCNYFGYMDKFIQAYDRVASVGDNENYFKVCMDTGHTNKAARFEGNPPPEEAIRMLGKRIACLHLNDNNGLTDQHKIPYSACIDFDAVFRALRDIGYEGTYNMEISLNHFGENFELEEAAFAVKCMKNILKTKKF